MKILEVDIGLGAAKTVTAVIMEKKQESDLYQAEMSSGVFQKFYARN
jgi:hypothetical protein